ncbi:NAD-dependent epimerase/dehydratase family protein [Cryptosporangium sp. NPDC048952]|uniref:NAD-dependent epimerase/dehydratase family protein n=1 Tax=Cryptosporangium sp. NPDC048952 TaxID=3363961 RepID=UPI003722849B
MRLLVLGGTQLLGSAVVRTALDSGWDVTTLTRGRHGTPPPSVDARFGDRTTSEGLDALGDDEWDVCIDTSGFVPSVVGLGARRLAGRVGRYVFVSTVNVYPDWPDKPLGPDSRVSDCPPDAGPDDGDYGYLKSGCERAVLEAFPSSTTINRSGLIFGPQDNIARVSWWVQRVAAGGEVLAPGRADQPIALIDSRDMATWMLTAPPGVFNVNSRPGTQTFGSLLSTAREVTGSDARFTWVDDQALVDAGVEPWSELPLWLPDAGHAWDMDVSGAYETGLRIRPLAESLADVWGWVREHGLPTGEGAERATEQEKRLTRSREREILRNL